MKNRLLALSCMIVMCAGAWAQENSPELEKLRWITGCWRDGDNGQTEEQWTRLAGQTMLGIGRTVKDGKTASYEFLQIRAQSDGIFYIAQPNGGTAVPFKLVKINSDQAVFENAEHDFPQRIVYQKQVDGSLLAALEGMEKGKPKLVQFPMKRVRCD